jgi:ectoine hydroxylase-related dioxygenase (phytanoyl-CoA dioxygenase family)
LRRSIPTFGSRSPLASLLSALDKHGAAIATGVVDTNLLRRIDQDLAPHVERERRRLARAGDAGSTTVRVGAIIAKTPAVVALLQSPLIHGVCQRFLLAHSSCYQLSSIHLVEVPPGAAPGAPHRDDVIWPLPGERPLAVINFLVPLTDFTARNGGTRVVLGSHRWRRDTSKVGPGRLDLDVVAPLSPADLLPAALKAGSILAVLGGIVHSTGANKTTLPRRALSISMNLGWLRQEENLYLSVPRKMLQALPVDVQALIGYRIHHPYLGHTGFE